MAVYWDEGLMQDEGRSPDVLAEGDWANELRPNANGFRKIAGKFRKTLLRRLP